LDNSVSGGYIKIMPDYDVILLHPPAIFDFRKKALFPGPMGTGVDQVQYSKVPIGLLSLAEYLSRHGYRVKVDNLCDRMVSDPQFNAEKHILGLSARVLGIDLHFQQHSPGAIEVARLYKQSHTDSLVVLGGLTATRFHQEIIADYPFIDAVIRAEAEKAFLQFMQALDKHHNITETPNITFRRHGGVCVTPLLPASVDLDEFEYTRFDLMEPLTSVFIPDMLPRWSLEVCRGCAYNCAICGGSAYTYKKYLGMSRPAFRSPAKIHEDILKLNSQGVRIIGLYQDPRVAGNKYTGELLAVLKKSDLKIDRLSLDLLVPADEEFIKSIAALGLQVTVHICPDTGSDSVRRRLGRHYSTAQLLRTINLCHQYLIPVTTFFSAGLAGETKAELMETWELWDKLSSLESISLARGQALGLSGGVPLGGPIMGPVLLDPGSQAFDSPAGFGYKLLYPTLKKYVSGLSGPSWFQWLNYETDVADKQTIAEMNMQSVAYGIEQSESYGFYTPAQATRLRQKMQADILAVTEVLRILRVVDPLDRQSQLQSLKQKIAKLQQ
jgi:B12-binding domain/radical SAM domain protein